MLFHLLVYLMDKASFLSWMNLFRYQTTRIIAATLTAMIISFVLGPWFIRRLQEQQIGQPIREDGPETHFVKVGTPTMGGSLILFSMVLSTVLWCDLTNGLIWMLLTITVGYGVIGFIDDSLKISKRSSAGIPGKVKLGLQVLIGTGAMIYTFKTSLLGPNTLELALPFVNFYSYSLALPLWLYVAFGVFVVVGFSNAVNLTDGLDGLAIVPVIMNAFFFMILAYLAGTILTTASGQTIAQYLGIAFVPEVGEAAIFCGALAGAGVGFLWYNTYPASVFMGDVGSLSLGGALGALAVMTKSEFLLIITGGIFVLETVSVILQVAFFKVTHRRIFLMAPIHHHFEKKGWAEPKVIVRFWIISFMLALIGLGMLKLR
jgi:phospho-N-acetylmuramoyl-pentapeptide-transferase